MKKKLFGNNIAPSCSCCSHSKREGDAQFCDVHRTLKEGKCRKFSYNPIMRTPLGAAPLQQFRQEDFSID